jgi:hypothetical protein
MAGLTQMAPILMIPVIAIVVPISQIEDSLRLIREEQEHIALQFSFPPVSREGQDPIQ